MRWSWLAVLPLLFLGIGCATPISAREPVKANINGRGLAAGLIGDAQAQPDEPQRDELAGVPVPSFDEAPEPPTLQDERVQAAVEVNPEEKPMQYRPTPGGTYHDNYGPKHGERRQVLAFIRTRGVQRCNGFRCTMDTSERDACAGLPHSFESMRQAGWGVTSLPTAKHVHVVDIDQYPQAAQQWGVTSAPTFILTVNGRPRARALLTTMKVTASEIATFYSTGALINAEMSRPHPREAWRARLPMTAGSQATEIESKTLLLPKTQINLERQAVEFVTSQESRLNRWLSIAFKAGEISHNGKTVNFSAPPEVRLHMTESGAGLMLDSLRSVEFTPTGANLHLTRLGTIPLHIPG